MESSEAGNRERERFKGVLAVWIGGGAIILVFFAAVSLLGTPLRQDLSSTQPHIIPCGLEVPQSLRIGQPLIAYSARTNWGNYEICVRNVEGLAGYALTSNGKNNLVEAWSPDNRKILVEQEDGQASTIYSLDTNKSNGMRINIAESAIGGDWSPDGKQIVFNGIDSPYPAYIINTDGTGIARIKTLIGQPWRPRWSPDGHKLPFASGVQIYTMGIDGNNLHQLTNRGENTDPVWSPDGKKIAFVSDRDWVHPPTPTDPLAAMITGTPLQGVYQIYVMDADGTNVKKLTTTGNNFRPSWSPDGTRIAFDRTYGGDHQIYFMNADGSDVTQLTFTGTNMRPVWSH